MGAVMRQDGHKPVHAIISRRAYAEDYTMAANVETMFYVREKPWHGLGTKVEEALTSEEALKVAGLDWTIEGKPIYDGLGREIAGYKANTRSSDNAVLGIVGNQYKVVQNSEAFAFTDSLIGEGIRYETAGSLRGGRQIWLLGKMPETYIAGDKFEPYICFTNTHDGSGAVRVCMTPIRVVCNNTLNMALSSAKRQWSASHRTNVATRLEEARETLQLADGYMKALAERADRMASVKMTEGEIDKAIDTLIALPEDATDRQKKTAEHVKEEIVVCMLRPDLLQFANTQWGFVNAISDYVGHAEPARHTKTFEENRWANIIGGHQFFDRAVALCEEGA